MSAGESLRRLVSIGTDYPAGAEKAALRGFAARIGRSFSRANWARLLRMVYEVDPLACPRRGARLAVVSVITVPSVIDEILRHLLKTGKDDILSARAPPAA